MPTTLKYMNQLRTQELITEIKRRLAKKQDIIQFMVMPTITSEMVGDVYQYIGDTTATYKNGDFYRVVLNPETLDPEYKQITYNKDEIDELIDAAGHFEVVEELPTTDIKTNVIYLVPKKKTLDGYVDSTDDSFYFPTGDETAPTFQKYDVGGNFVEDVTGADAETVQANIDDGTFTAETKTCKVGQVNNVKDEYINLDGTVAGWEKIGDTEIDLSGYVKHEELVAITAEELEDMWRTTGILNLSTDTVTVAAEETADVDVTSTGAIVLLVGDTDVATAVYANGKITITGVATGTTDVTVISSATEDYKAVTATIAVTVS